ncbi:hypothetical protein [Lysinibacter cavernae]|uniref:Holin n=1 Tax=Lysinibacter cavernae TaxID=1640652 RepID=A0A7X5R198_9MICO|nr:hypothetical protein [Lysinibacter cavernae]NIH53741.1 hypothetical protein [Lysinibacter cavernae]
MKLTTEDAALHDAAVRAGIRTAAQALGGALAPLGVTAGVLTGGSWIALGIAAGGSLITSLIAGTAAYLNFIGNGLPEAYSVLASERARSPKHAAE